MYDIASTIEKRNMIYFSLSFAFVHARYSCMKTVLGDLLAKPPDVEDGVPLPSPESLRGKIIIKGKVVRDGEVKHKSSTPTGLCFFHDVAFCF